MRVAPALLIVATLASRASAASDAGPPELPGPPLPLPFPWLAAGGVAAALAVATLVAWRLARRAPADVPSPAPEAPGIAPDAQALEHLAALRDRPCSDGADVDAFHDDLAAVLREFVANVHGIPGCQTTTEEFAAGVREVLPANEASALVAILRRCDLARFARIGSSQEGRSALLHDAEALVRTTHATPVVR